MIGVLINVNWYMSCNCCIYAEFYWPIAAYVCIATSIQQFKKRILPKEKANCNSYDKEGAQLMK
jgi:hypothetical protein